MLGHGDSHTVRGHANPVHRGWATSQAGEHVLLDHIHVHHAGRVPPGTGRGRRAPGRRPRERRIAQVLHVLSVGVLRLVLPGNDVLFPQVAVGYAGGRAHVHAGYGPAVRAGRREGTGKAEEDTRQLHAHPHPSEYPPVNTSFPATIVSKGKPRGLAANCGWEGRWCVCLSPYNIILTVNSTYRAKVTVCKIYEK